MAQHLIGKVGAFSAHYADSTAKIIIRSEAAKLWRFDLEAEAGLSDLHELMQATGTATAEELRFLVGLVLAAETIIEHAEHDLAQYGEIGVTY